MVRLTVISPVLNEGEVLEELVTRTTRVLRKSLGKDWEFMLVDDASTDNTPEIARRLAKGNPNLTYVRHKQRGGQTGCFRTAFAKARGEYVMTMDGDLQVFPEDIPLFISKIDEGYDIVNGIREHRKLDKLLILVSRLYNIFMLMFFDCPAIDASSNYTAFRKDFVEGLPLRNNDHRYLIPMAMRRGARRIGEVVVHHGERKKGKSKYKLSNKFIKGGPEIMRVWFRLKGGVYDRSSDD